MNGNPSSLANATSRIYTIGNMYRTTGIVYLVHKRYQKSGDYFNDTLRRTLTRF